ncbi:hypothetical protein F8388_020257 [Cannabis sativa]|uniref:RNase H type-1 domain-containing protein n=1 Tax=Cannabis sativa TaxID=3483 RepID=A0A7J6FVF8_CANSA|nr:hypothetical protein F8388_020257 [Cannabis sativa]KAF4404161.1 hypothetical protein G4B88_014617 [Cannabis sativa]
MDKGKKVISANDNDPSMVADHGTMQQINVGEVGSNEAAAILEGKILKLKKVGGNQSLDGCSYLRNTNPSKGVNASAQQIITCNDITLASNGPSLTGQKKRKAAEWVIPIVQSPTNEKSSCSLPSLEVACYSAGSKGGVDSGSTSKQRQSKRICASKGRKKATGRTKNQLGSPCKEEERGKFLTFVGTLFDTIWFSRNAVFFRGNQANVMSAIHKMLHKMEEFISVQGNFQDCNDLHQFSREKVWCVPNAVHGFFVTDASWKEGRAGIAVGCQDRQSGKWLWSAKAMDADSAMEAEALAVFWALQLGSECGFSSIAVASDALLLVQSLTALKLPPCWKSRAAVAKIWSLFDVFTSCVFIHLNRIDNGSVEV